MRAPPPTRIAFGLTCVAVSVMLAAESAGLIPDSRDTARNGRRSLCEAVSINCSLLASQGQLDEIKHTLGSLVERNPELLSAALLDLQGHRLAEVQDADAAENPRSADRVTRMDVPVLVGDARWGNVELVFHSLSTPGLLGLFEHPAIRLTLFTLSASFAVYLLYLRQMLEHLDPSKVVPDRVRAALDTLTGGLLILDKEERIVLANQSFADTLGRTPMQLVGCRASELPWQRTDGKTRSDFPWTYSLQNGVRRTGVMLSLKADETSRRTFLVNSSPIFTDDGKQRGVLASFDDVTQLEEKKTELTRMLNMLKQSREEISRQNDELRALATLDPLTSCLNRRSFFDQFDQRWNYALTHSQPLTCLMVDVDHFKAVNDEHGHAVGDSLLRHVGEVLRHEVGDRGLVCRYGGEEFCVLLPGMDLYEAAEVGESIRNSLALAQPEGIALTASIGIGSTGFGAQDPHELMKQADDCLYYAKHNGRNRVERIDGLPLDWTPMAAKQKNLDEETESSIPFHAVTALMSALGYRDLSTAEHSRRVADLCVMMAESLMSVTDVYVLEIGALLHDIGKIGVPDNILLKPGPLTKEEWKYMRAHDRIGVEIVESTFECPALTRILQTHFCWYGGNPAHPNQPSGDEIPLQARVLGIADAYDAIVSDRVYRPGRPPQEAFDELRRCAGTQFDPELVERFIDALQEREDLRQMETVGVSQQTALTIGQEIERLALALDTQDIDGLAAMAGRLHALATKYEVPAVADLAAELEHVANNDADLQILIQLTSDLLDICRSTQRAYFDQERAGRRPAPRAAKTG